VLFEEMALTYLASADADSDESRTVRPLQAAATPVASPSICAPVGGSRPRCSREADSIDCIVAADPGPCVSLMGRPETTTPSNAAPGIRSPSCAAKLPAVTAGRAWPAAGRRPRPVPQILCLDAWATDLDC